MKKCLHGAQSENLVKSWHAIAMFHWWSQFIRPLTLHTACGLYNRILTPQGGSLYFYRKRRHHNTKPIPLLRLSWNTVFFRWNILWIFKVSYRSLYLHKPSIYRKNVNDITIKWNVLLAILKSKSKIQYNQYMKNKGLYFCL